MVSCLVLILWQMIRDMLEFCRSLLCSRVFLDQAAGYSNGDLAVLSNASSSGLMLRWSPSLATSCIQTVNLEL